MDEQPVPGGAGGGGQLTYKNINSKVWFRRRASAVLLSNLIPEFSSARQKHGVWTGPKWDQNMQFTLAKKNNGYAPAFSFGSLLSEGCLRGVGGGVSLVASYLVCVEKMEGVWRVLLHPPRPGCFWIRAVPLTALQYVKNWPQELNDPELIPAVSGTRQEIHLREFVFADERFFMFCGK